jgi:hypothetical protein
MGGREEAGGMQGLMNGISCGRGGKVLGEGGVCSFRLWLCWRRWIRRIVGLRRRIWLIRVRLLEEQEVRAVR